MAIRPEARGQAPRAGFGTRWPVYTNPRGAGAPKGNAVLDPVPIALEEIYVPAKRRRTRDDARVDALALDILENGLKNPIHVRRDEARYVLVEGLHRLEAVRALGEETVAALVVSARRH